MNITCRNQALPIWRRIWPCTSRDDVDSDYLAMDTSVLWNAIIRRGIDRAIRANGHA